MNRNLNVKWYKESATITTPSTSVTDCKIKLLYDESLWLVEERKEEKVIKSSKFETLADASKWCEDILLSKTN